MQRLLRAGWLALAAATAALDLWSKALWVYRDPALLEDNPTRRTIIEGWLEIHAVWNKGGVWSVDLPGWLLFAGTLVAVPLLVAWLLVPAHPRRWDSAAKALVLGGALGNLWDRWQWDMVRDWIGVTLWGWDYPRFNVADAALVVGIGMLLIGSFRRRPAAGVEA